MKYIRVRGWFKEGADPDARYIIEEAEGCPASVGGRLYAVSRDSSGTYSVYDVRRGIYVFGGQTMVRTWKIIRKPGFVDRAEDSVRAMVQGCHEEKQMETRIREEYERRGQQDRELNRVWKIANKPFVTLEDEECLRA